MGNENKYDLVTTSSSNLATDHLVSTSTSTSTSNNSLELLTTLSIANVTESRLIVSLNDSISNDSNLITSDQGLIVLTWNISIASNDSLSSSNKTSIASSILISSNDSLSNGTSYNKNSLSSHGTLLSNDSLSNKTLNETWKQEPADQESNITLTTVLPVAMISELTNDKVFLYDNKTINQTEIDNIESGSGDGIDIQSQDVIANTSTEVNLKLNLTKENESRLNRTNENGTTNVGSIIKDIVESVPWKIYDFLKNKNNKNSDSEEIYQDIYNVSSDMKPLNHTKLNQTIKIDFNRTAINKTSAFNQTSTSRFSFFGSAARANCLGFNQTSCNDWSTAKLLLARLCCLKQEMGDDDEPGFGCQNFGKQKCMNMLPLIKCCLKDFSQLLEGYFKGKSVSQRKSNQRLLSSSSSSLSSLSSPKTF